MGPQLTSRRFAGSYHARLRPSADPALSLLHPSLPPAEPERGQRDDAAGSERGGLAEGSEPPYHQLLAPQPQSVSPERAGPGHGPHRPHQPCPLDHWDAQHHPLDAPSSPHLRRAWEHRPQLGYPAPTLLPQPDTTSGFSSCAPSHSLLATLPICLLGPHMGDTDLALHCLLS